MNKRISNNKEIIRKEKREETRIQTKMMSKILNKGENI
jgi:hypothetical protein